MPETNKELGKGGAEMVSIEKPDIQELVRALEKLDKISLLLIDSGAKLLVARQNMEKESLQNSEWW